MVPKYRVKVRENGRQRGEAHCQTVAFGENQISDFAARPGHLRQAKAGILLGFLKRANILKGVQPIVSPFELRLEESKVVAGIDG